MSNLPNVAEAVANSGLRVGSSGLKAHPQSHAVPGVAECETLLAMEGTYRVRRKEKGLGEKNRGSSTGRSAWPCPGARWKFASEVQRRQSGQGGVWERRGRDRCCGRRGHLGVCHGEQWVCLEE